MENVTQITWKKNVTLMSALFVFNELKDLSLSLSYIYFTLLKYWNIYIYFQDKADTEDTADIGNALKILNKF